MNILIIGAGVAGSSAAIELCKAGFEVKMIDIATFPRFRPGESCHPGIEPLLKRLDIWPDILKLNPMRYNATCVNYEGEENTNFFNKNRSWKGFQFPREDFDNAFLNKAISLGTCFIPLTKTLKFNHEKDIVRSVITDKGEFNFDFLIDATGSKSLSSIKLSLKREKHSKPIIANYNQIYTAEKLPNRLKSYFEITNAYWGYVSLIKAKTYAVTFSSINNNGYKSQDFIKKFFFRNYSEQISKSFETSWQITNNDKFNNLYLIGDASMTFDPTSSKGILKSIMTGIYAARTLKNIADNTIEKNIGHQMFQNWSKDFFHKELLGIKKILPDTMVKSLFDNRYL